MIYFVTGGARSGKSSYSMKLAMELSPNPLYMATARQWKGDFQARIDRHKAERDKSWTSIEEEKFISKHDLEGKVVVIDCVTLWLTNFFIDTKNNVDRSLNEAKAELKQLVSKRATFIIISNELGMGVHAETEAGRKFTDLQGWMNQHIANLSDKVIFMVSGIPMTIKDTLKK